MRSKKKYIAILLLGVFVLPVIYLPWHILCHHRHDENTEENISFHSDKSDFTLHNHKKWDKVTHCSICEYQIPVFNFFQIFVYKSFTSVNNGVLVENIIKPHIKYVCLIRIPRAPPVFLF